MLPVFHRLVTRRALRQLAFAPHVEAIVAETSCWTDLYRWTDTIANASTPVDEHGVPRDTRASAAACAELLRGYLRRLEGGTLNEQLLWLGFALHLVQDLAVHEGRTDPEHTFQFFLLAPNPDWNPIGISRGLRFSLRVMETVRDRLGRAFGQLQLGSGARLLTDDEAVRLLGPKTFTLPALWQTLASCRLYLRTPRTIRRVRWDTETVLREGLAATPEIASPK